MRHTFLSRWLKARLIFSEDQVKSNFPPASFFSSATWTAGLVEETGPLHSVVIAIYCYDTFLYLSPSVIFYNF